MGDPQTRSQPYKTLENKLQCCSIKQTDQSVIQRSREIKSRVL